MDVRLELPLLKCTGCSACANVCPADAISMEINESGFGAGFRYPRIDTDACIKCGKCVSTCPILNPDYSTNKKPGVYSVKCPSFQNTCASGGVYGFLAEKFLEDGGGVCGAAFDEEFNLKERYIESIDELPPLLKSKYLQSDPADVYPKVKEALKTGKNVLFCSTPCQVAGLKAYLKKVPKNLFCVDLLCRGVPSNEVFKRYIKENVTGEVENIEFRSKEVGWTTSMTYVRPKGKTEHISRREDPYIRLFESWAALRESCYECPFNRVPRQGDLTIGDHWGIGAENRDKKGVSIVLVNNKKGEALLKMLDDADNSIVKTDLPAASARNRAMTKATLRPEVHAKLTHALETMSITDAFWYSGMIKKDVCMVIMSNWNYGNNITNWSLYRAIKKMGYSIVLVSRFNTHRKSPLFQKSPYLADETYIQEPYALNEHCKIFLVGCDQTFAPMGIKKQRLTLLPWVRGDRYKMSYSASLGKSEFESSPDNIREFGFLFKRFDAISVRESSGPRIMHDTFGVDAEYVLDPVFLSSAEDYRRLIKRSKAKVPDEKFVHCYLLDPIPEKIEAVKAYAKKIGISKITCVVNKGEGLVIDGFDVYKAKVETFLKLIDRCELFLTDSFHGMCMSIILNKNFYALTVSKFRGLERFNSILGFLGLEDRWSTNAEPKFDDIDFEEVNKKLSTEIERSRNWLAEHLAEGMEFDKPLDAYDMQLINADRIQSCNTTSFKQMSVMMNGDCDNSDIYEPEVCSMLGNCYLNGKYVAKDPKKGIAWLKRACESFDTSAMIALCDALAEMDDEESKKDLLSVAR